MIRRMEALDNISNHRGERTVLYERSFLRKCLLAGFIVCSSALGWVPGVSAEKHETGSAAAPFVLEEVVVVGTRFQERSVTDSPVPVDVIRREEIQATGQHEVGRAIQSLIPSFNFSSSSISDGTDALRPATLRGMGPDQVLVLVNGKRRHGSALIHVNRSVGRGTAGTDLNAIPLGAIKRIEVLRDGASAQYGSDAIAGVINIVLKDDVDGGIRASYGTTYEGDGDQYVVSLDKGFRIGTDGVLHATFEYRNRERTNRAGLSGAIQYPDTVTCTLSECTSAQLPNRAALLGNNPGDTTVILNDPGDKEKNFNRRNFRIGDGDSVQFSGALNFDTPIGNGLELYSFADVSRRENETGGFYRRANQDDRNPPGSGYPDGFLPLMNTTIWDFSLGAGLVREFGNGLKADLGVVHGGNTFNFEITNSHNASWVNCRLDNPIRMGDCDGFSGSGPASTSADSGTLGLYLTTVNLDFSLPVRDKNLNLAWGAEYRRDNYRIEAGEEYSYADYDGIAGATSGIQVFPGFRPASEVDESRHAFSFYTDAEMSLRRIGGLDELMVSPAVRYEHYSDFGHTVNGKLAAKLDFSPKFALRGSMSSGFRAPSMHQLYFSSLSTQFVTPPGGGELVAQEIGTFRNNSAAAKAIGIPELKQETAINLSGGFVYTPLPSLTLTTDFYHIAVQDRIILSGTVKKEFLSADVIAELERVSAGEGQFFMNAVDTETRGVDFVASWDVPSMPRGSLNLSFLGSLMETKIKSVNLPAGLPSGLFDARERSIIEEWQPKSRFTLSGLYRLGQFSASVAVHRYGEYTVSNDSGSVKQKFDPKYLTDAQLSYDFGQFGILKLGANNLFDVTPDEDTIDTSRGGRIIDSQGNLIVDSPDVFTYSRRSAPFGFNGGFYYLAFELRF